MFPSSGTPIYMAPEVLTEFQSYSFPADIWSFGALISYMCNGEHLFMSEDDVFDWGIQNPVPRHYSAKLRGLVTRMLHPNRKQRPNAEYILNETWKGDRLRSDL